MESQINNSPNINDDKNLNLLDAHLDFKTESDRKVAIRVSFISILVNISLSVLKLIVGFLANSGAMISDAVHSASDVFSTFIVLIGVKISSKASDKDHQYGHERFECVAAIILATVLALTGIGIGITGINKIINSSSEDIGVPGAIALVVAAISIVTKEWMYHFTKSAAKKINSNALMADAWHHRSDALSSIGALIGIGGARLGFPILDPLASIVICLFIEKAAYDIFKDAVDKMVDKAAPEEYVANLRNIVMSEDGVLGIDLIKTRLFGSKIYVDVEIIVDGNQTLRQAHEIAERVHDAIEDSDSNIKHCMVHENPEIGVE